ncbi:extracellular solute-binding protein [Nocardiopsis mangrovi]|uniref:Extracellular solute-binding protein n=1 Tax=Nocardiopsis mangrovi TaxID=1179818 RepID=A0ABV9DTP3_9ACTN
MRSATPAARRGLAVLCATLAVALAATACIGRTSSTTTDDGARIIRFLHSQPAGTFADAIELFEAEHPDVHIEEQPVPFDDLNAQVQARVGAQDTSVDVFAADPPRVPAQAERGFLVDVSDDSEAIREAVVGPAMDSVSWDGRVWAYPLWTSSSFLFYNRDLLDAAGIDEPGAAPDDRLTWEEVADQGREAQDAGARYGLGFDQVDRYFQLQPLLASAGAGDGLAGEGALHPDVAGPQWREVMDWYAGLHSSRLSPRGIDPQQMPDVFTSGQLAYFVGGPGRIGPFLEAEGLDFGIAPHPYFAGGEAVTPTDSWAVGVSAYSAHPDDARAFARFLSLDSAGALATTGQMTLPPANAVAYDDYIERTLDSGGDSVAGFDELLAYELETTARHRPRSVGYVDFETTINKAFSDIRNGSDVAESLSGADEQLDNLLQRYRDMN